MKRAEDDIRKLNEINALKEAENDELKDKLKAFEGRELRERCFGSVNYRDIIAQKD